MLTNIIRKMADFVLLNAYSVNSSGFYNGKAGMSLALFEVSRLLQDEYLEVHAFELLQEALLYKGQEIGFENGLAGIGFVFRYLIDNRFIEADFYELFGEHTKKVEDYLLDNKQNFSNLASPLSRCIDRLYLLRKDTIYNNEEIEILESYIYSDDELVLETKLKNIMMGMDTKVGYENGIVRWLLYIVFCECSKRDEDTTRFDDLFKLLPVWKR